MNHFHVPGVSAAYFDSGELRWNRCFGVLENGSTDTVTENTIFHACSISKMITALCIIRLAQDKRLSLYTDVNKYLTAWKIPEGELLKHKKVTPANLLSHQAGFYDLEGSFEPHHRGDPAPKPIDLLRGTTRYNSEEVRVKYEPETDFAYSDAGYCIVAQLVEALLGETVPQIAKRFIFDPLGLKHTFFWEIGEGLGYSDKINPSCCASGHDSNGITVEDRRAHYPNIEGAALWTTPTELSVITLDLLASYNNGGGVVLDQEMARIMLTPHGNSPFSCLGLFYDSREDFYFTQGWGVGMQCKMRFYPKTQRGVAVMTNSEPGIEQDKALVGEIIDFVCKHGEL